MNTQPLGFEILKTWMVTLNPDLTIRAIREPDAGSCEIPFLNDLPIGFGLMEAMGLPEDRSQALAALLRAGKEIKSYRYVIDNALLGSRHYNLSAVPLQGQHGTMGYHCVIADLTPTIELANRSRRNEAELAAIIDASPTFLTVKDIEGRYLRVNAAARGIITPWCRAPLGLNDREIFPADIAASMEMLDDDVLEHERAREFEQVLPFARGTATFLVIKFPIFDTDGAVIGVGATGIDISERKMMESELYRLANYDTLTEIPNRRLCNVRLDEAVVLGQHLDQSVAVILADINGFRALNNTLGNNAGDDILIEAAWRLKSSLTAAGTVSRLGGDEFCLVIPATSQREVAGTMERIHAAFHEPMLIDSREVFVGVTLGAAVYPNHADGPEQLIHNADIALMMAKRTDAPSKQFSDEMAAFAEQCTRISSLLRRAIDREEFALVYQPIVEAATGRPVMLEALLRWTSAELGTIPPDTFIPLAEDAGLIGAIGKWSLRRACADAAAWNRRRLSPLAVAVNVSPRQLFGDGFVSLVAHTLDETGLAPSLLKIEITESSLVQDVEQCRRILEGLAAIGVTLALDDFGTGYSALSYLQQFRFHVLKLDRSFIRKMVPGNASSALTASIIAMAKSLGMQTVAEGVEHKAQWDELRALGSDFCQGFHFGHPLPKQDIQFLHDDRGI